MINRMHPGKHRSVAKLPTVFLSVIQCNTGGPWPHTGVKEAGIQRGHIPVMTAQAIRGHDVRIDDLRYFLTTKTQPTSS